MQKKPFTHGIAWFIVAVIIAMAAPLMFTKPDFRLPILGFLSFFGSESSIGMWRQFTAHTTIVAISYGTLATVTWWFLVNQDARSHPRFMEFIDGLHAAPATGGAQARTGFFQWLFAAALTCFVIPTGFIFARILGLRRTPMLFVGLAASAVKNIAAGSVFNLLRPQAQLLSSCIVIGLTITVLLVRNRRAIRRQFDGRIIARATLIRFGD